MTAPVSSLPFSQARRTDGLLYLSGQIGLKNGKLASPDLADQLRQTVANIEKVLKDRGLSLANVVDVTVFLIDMGEYSAFNEVYRDLFKDPYPTRTTVCVAELPFNARVELKVVASVP